MDKIVMDAVLDKKKKRKYTKKPKKKPYKDVLNNGNNVKYKFPGKIIEDVTLNVSKHFSIGIISFSNVFVKGITDLFLIIPGFLASVSLLILSPCYRFTSTGSKEARKIGWQGLKIIPLKIISSLLEIIISPLAYPISYTVKKTKIEEVVYKDYSGPPAVI